MSKVMKAKKKIWSFLCMVMLMVAAFPMTVLAEEERTAVYVQIPQDWENPCAWAWDADGNNAFEAWPGGELEIDSANEGWYYVWLPSWATHVIINANEGNVQTEELILEEKDAWITVNAADSVEISYEKMTTGDAPEYVEKFVIHAKVDESWETPCLWAWSAPDGTNAFEAWPGIEMKEDENGWYSAKAPIWVNSIIVNANEGGVQTEDISIDPAEVWVTVDAEGAYDFSYTDPDKEEVPNVTVHVMAPTDWESPCLWAWSAPDGTNVYTTWPGETLEESENGWLTKEIPGWVNSIIVNGSEGTVQTTDISVETGKELWVVVSGPEEYEVSYEEPVIDATTEEAVQEDTANDIEEAQEAETVSEETPVEKGNNTIVVIIVIAVVAVIAGVVIVINKKKGSN
ncbi:MAG: starch-binding protein [Lachnospiraceae bacterium]|nr:starch-binding protein [Lachnospiraceae bacterium]